MADTFEHTPHVWTAARLHDALSGLPDDTPIHIGAADSPGDFEGYGEFVLVGAEPVEIDPGSETVSLDGSEVQFTLFAGAKAGVYFLDMD
ncbi:DUF6225 family protein [Streptomyces sp. MB09-01]|uniref:DUF6225 family protein n=1 Tax=Streptomyces sp. MB09-01 TaxID=3028666 RepID=UPI0029B12495|nr:DUF6225 family protein [Streptomyces sp. MB09-01]MDX3539916.1 DUF6225 family protein [Streptomyces sp. MB09-01]